MVERLYYNAYLQDDRTIVALFRDAEGNRRGKKIRARWSSFHETASLSEEMARELRAESRVEKLSVDGKWTRVDWITRDARYGACRDPRSPLAQAGAFEADVDPVRRWLVDERVSVAKPARCYLDLETDSRVSFVDKESARILSWAVVGADGNRDRMVLTEDSDAAERVLLGALWVFFQSYDQVAAWNGDDFDFPVLWARSRRARIVVNANLWLWIDHLKAFKKLNAHSAKSGEVKQSMRLDDVASGELKVGKKKTPQWVKDRFGDRNLGALTYDLWASGEEGRKLLLEYNEDDADLLARLEEKTGFLKLVDAIGQTCGMFPDGKALLATKRGDAFMMRFGEERGVRFPTFEYREAGEDDEKFAGAEVLTPKTLDRAWRKARGMRNGIARDAHVADFSGMYPNIIVAWNMSPETRAVVPREGPVPAGFTRCPLTGTGFRLDVVGILASVVLELMAQRKRWSDEKDKHPFGSPEYVDAEKRADALKIIINSMYGMTGSLGSRFYERSLAEGITQNGVWLIRRVILECEKRGWDVLYSDTDSAMVSGPTRAEFEAFAKWCNESLFGEMLAEVNCEHRSVKVAYEKEFSAIVFGAKKRYVASVCHAKGKYSTKETPPEIKGYEYKRGDALRLGRELQAEVIDLLVGGLKAPRLEAPNEDVALYEDLVREARRRVLEDPLVVEDVRLSKSLNKPLKEYVAKARLDGKLGSQPQHVEVAKVLQARGAAVTVGTRIEYVVVDGASSPAKVIPASEFDGSNVDRYHLWDTLVYPPTERLLQSAFPDEDWERWGRVRPPKPRGGTRVLPGQLAFPDVAPVIVESRMAPRGSVAFRAASGARSGEAQSPSIVEPGWEVDEDGCEVRIDRRGRH